MQYRVTSAELADPIRVASPRDFSRERGRPFQHPDASLLPYCIDIWRRRSLYVAGIEPARARAATFYYQGLREAAREVVSIPFEHGPVHAGPRRAKPVLVFSPGRVGSTLLCSVLSETGVACVSEPDFYTQAATDIRARFPGLRGQIENALQNLTTDLLAILALDHLLIIKLRSQCCWSPDIIAGHDRPRTIFITRNFAGWARSTIRAFNTDPPKAVSRYLRSLQCHAWLARNTDCQLIWYDDLTTNDRAAIAPLERLIGRPIPPEIVARALSRDSQAETALARDQPPKRPGWEQKLERALALWDSDKVLRLRAQVPLGQGH